jgi:hypothetical protein
VLRVWSLTRIRWTALYSSIAFGLPFSVAFDQAALQVRLVLGEYSGEPRLYVADGLDPDDL